MNNNNTVGETIKRNKCEWCEERRYTLMSNKEMGTLYCMNLDEDDKGYLIEILRQKPPKAIWEIKYTRRIYYCPFCGRKLERKGEK